MCTIDGGGLQHVEYTNAAAHACLCVALHTSWLGMCCGNWPQGMAESIKSHDVSSAKVSCTLYIKINVQLVPYAAVSIRAEACKHSRQYACLLVWPLPGTTCNAQLLHHLLAGYKPCRPF